MSVNCSVFLCRLSENQKLQSCHLRYISMCLAMLQCVGINSGSLRGMTFMIFIMQRPQSLTVTRFLLKIHSEHC